MLVEKSDFRDTNIRIFEVSLSLHVAASECFLTFRQKVKFCQRQNLMQWIFLKVWCLNNDAKTASRYRVPDLKYGSIKIYENLSNQ